jgi:hypothetical protein
MSKPNTLEICRVHLFDNKDELLKQSIPEMLIQRIIRIRSAYTFWLEHPRKKDVEIRDHLLNFGINKSAAYEDIQIIKLLLGDMTKTSKDFHRFKFNSMIQLTAELSERKKDYKTMEKAWADYAKYNQLDKEDAFKIPFEEIIIQPFEPTSDPTVLGIQKVPNIKEKIEKMKNKYMHDIAEDIEYETVDFNEDDLFNAPMKIDEK